MATWIYIAMCVPAVLMIIAGIALGKERRNSTIKQHHFARKFNINNYAKKIVTLFTFTGFAFSLGGILIVSSKTLPGIAIVVISFIIFLISYSSIQKKHG